MKRKRARGTLPVLKGGFETDQPLVVGKRYRFVYKLMPGMPEISREGVLLSETVEYYYVQLNEMRNEDAAIPIERVIEVNEIIGG